MDGRMQGRDGRDRAGSQMMESRWLPTMPVHVADVTMIVMVHRLTEAEEGRLFRLARESWAARRLLPRPEGTTDACWAALRRVWAGLDEYRQQHEDGYRRRSARNRENAQARWQGGARGDVDASRIPVASQSHPASDASRMRVASQSHPTDDASRIPVASESECETDASRTDHHHHHHHHQNQNQNHHQQLDKQADIGGVGRRAARRAPASKRRPSDLVLTTERLDMARKRGLSEAEAAREWSSMGDHEFRVGKSDWDAAWRRWCDTAADRKSRYGQPRAVPRFAAEASQSVADRLRAGLIGPGPSHAVVEVPFEEEGA